MVKRRKDSKGVVLKDGEYQRSNGTYEFKWQDKIGRRKSIYAKTLKELREKELDILRNTIDGINNEGSSLSVNDTFKLWTKVKRGLKNNTFKITSICINNLSNRLLVELNYLILKDRMLEVFITD